MEGYLLWFGIHGRPSIMQTTRTVQGMSEDMPGPSPDEVPTMPYPPRHEEKPRLVRR